jgi:hypothetical protein
MNAAIELKAGKMFSDPQCGHHPMQISSDASFHQSWTGPFQTDCIDYSVARVAFEIGHIAALHNCQAAVAIGTRGDVRDVR